MLDIEKTKQECGYDVSVLSFGSNKRIYIKCDYCGNIYSAPYKQYIKSRNVIDKDACNKCKYEKRKDISLKLYGVANSAQRPEVRKKISENCEGFDDKRRQSIKEKYGVDNAMESEECKAKQKQVVSEKYGVENVSNNENIKQKRIDTCIELYGTEYFTQSDQFKKSLKETMYKRFFNSERYKNIIEPNFSIEEYTGIEDYSKKYERTICAKRNFFFNNSKLISSTFSFNKNCICKK